LFSLIPRYVKTGRIPSNLSLWRATKSLWIALHVLGTTSIYMDDESAALEYLSKATRLTRQIGSEAFLTSLLPGYTLILHRRGQVDRALSLLGLALARPACESDTRLEIEKILAGWGMSQDLESVSRLGDGLDLSGEIDGLQALV